MREVERRASRHHGFTSSTGEDARASSPNRNAPFLGRSISGFRLVLGSLFGHLRAFLAPRLSGGLRRRGNFLLARHLGFSSVNWGGLSGRCHDVLLMSRAVMARRDQI